MIQVDIFYILRRLCDRMLQIRKRQFQRTKNSCCYLAHANEHSGAFLPDMIFQRSQNNFSPFRVYIYKFSRRKTMQWASESVRAAARNKAHFLFGRLSIHTSSGSLLCISALSMTIQGFLLCKRLFIIEFDGISYWKYARLAKVLTRPCLCRGECIKFSKVYI